ncbi:hypothetical protein GOP47_0009578 [Adiantum capillus-veneris]|uniref:Uncharacterized protein n=1 Tax=Adiantum capillus-veneris TaxID=13818 RepID=A0A9D4ZIU8_ADICA|nr:hypothetical protein GOP47_0009578 [Adiantum capillus-veneris]
MKEFEEQVEVSTSHTFGTQASVSEPIIEVLDIGLQREHVCLAIQQIALHRLQHFLDVDYAMGFALTGGMPVAYGASASRDGI